MDKRKLKKKTLSVISKLYVILIFLFFYAPVVVMVVFSFNDSRANVVWQGFTTKWYTKLFQDTELWMVFGKTLFIAVVTTLLGVVVGTMGAVGFMNAKFKGKKADHKFYLFSDCYSGDRTCDRNTFGLYTGRNRPEYGNNHHR